MFHRAAGATERCISDTYGFLAEWCAAHLLLDDMEKQVFDYYKDEISEHDILFYGFHRHNGKISIDTKRLKKVFAHENCSISDYFPIDGFMTETRNTHYFVPAKKKRLDYSVNYLVDCLRTLLSDWEKEYIPMIKTIKTPEEVEQNSISSRIAFTSNMDDYDEILERATIENSYRIVKYNELVRSILVQYIQRIHAEYLRVMFFVLKQHGYHNEEDLGGFNDVTRFVQRKFADEYGKKNPIFGLKNHRYFLLVSLLSNFTKHNSLKSYNDLYNNPFERNPEVKKFLKTFVYGDEEHKFPNGGYAANWVNITFDKVIEIIQGLIDFSYEFCELCFDESPYDSQWNYDQYFLRGIHKFIDEVIECNIDVY